MTDHSEAAKASLSITLAMTDEIRASIQRGASYLEVAKSYEITDAETAQLAANELNVINKAVDKLEDLRKGFVAPAKVIIENASSLFNPAIEGYTESATLLKSRLGEWQVKEQQRVALENKAREDAERKARQEAEQKAAAERARAEEQAAAERKKAEAADEARRKAEAEGNTRAAAAHAAEAAKATERATAAVENGAAKATQAHMEAAAAVTATRAVVAPTKITGMSTRENWVPALKPGVSIDRAKELIVAVIAGGRKDLLAVIEIDESALKKLFKALKAQTDVPGYVAKNEPIIASSRK